MRPTFHICRPTCRRLPRRIVVRGDCQWAKFPWRRGEGDCPRSWLALSRIGASPTNIVTRKGDANCDRRTCQLTSLHWPNMELVRHWIRYLRRPDRKVVLLRCIACKVFGAGDGPEMAHSPCGRSRPEQPGGAPWNAHRSSGDANRVLPTGRSGAMLAKVGGLTGRVWPHFVARTRVRFCPDSTEF